MYYKKKYRDWNNYNLGYNYKVGKYNIDREKIIKKSLFNIILIAIASNIITFNSK